MITNEYNSEKQSSNQAQDMDKNNNTSPSLSLTVK